MYWIEVKKISSRDSLYQTKLNWQREHLAKNETLDCQQNWTEKVRYLRHEYYFIYSNLFHIFKAKTLILFIKIYAYYKII